MWCNARQLFDQMGVDFVKQNGWEKSEFEAQILVFGVSHYYYYDFV